jgi:hypothetical protein
MKRDGVDRPASHLNLGSGSGRYAILHGLNELLDSVNALLRGSGALL